MKLNFPFSDQLRILFEALLDKGDELRLVGGCVRDFLINKEVADIDLACKYRVEKVIEILEKKGIKVIPTGIKHGTVTAVIDGKSFEITTLRQDVKTDGRSAEVDFIDDFYLDAKRRDFTINALSLDYSGELYDYFDGQKDLENKIVKFIGNPEQRIQEDYLRILRFFRFSCFYADIVNEDALQAIKSLKDNISQLSADRIRNELLKIISHNGGDKVYKILSIMKELGVLDLAIKDNLDLQYLGNLFYMESKIGKVFDVLVRFAALIHNRKDSVVSIAKDLHFSNQDVKYISLITNPGFDIDIEISKSDLYKLLFNHDREIIVGSLIIKISSGRVDDLLIKKFIELKNKIINSEMPEFPLNGNDLLEIGVDAKSIGKLLISARNNWIDSDFSLDKTALIKYIDN